MRCCSSALACPVRAMRHSYSATEPSPARGGSAPRMVCSSLSRMRANPSCCRIFLVSWSTVSACCLLLCARSNSKPDAGVGSNSTHGQTTRPVKGNRAEEEEKREESTAHAVGQGLLQTLRFVLEALDLLALPNPAQAPVPTQGPLHPPSQETPVYDSPAGREEIRG